MSKQAKTVGIVLGGLAVVYFFFLRSSTSTSTTTRSLLNRVAGSLKPTQYPNLPAAQTTGPATESRTGRAHF